MLLIGTLAVDVFAAGNLAEADWLVEAFAIASFFGSGSVKFLATDFAADLAGDLLCGFEEPILAVALLVDLLVVA
ncbi:MAG: hypothetical protein ABI557_00915 [Aureliella sp.]